MDEAFDPMQGATDLGDGLTPIDIWQGLHANARNWSAVRYGASQHHDRTLIDGSDLSVFKALATFPAAKWSAMCEAVGWTIYGAVGLSWCKDTALSEVVAAWKETGLKINPTPEMRRPAQMINPAIFPETNSLREAVIAVESDVLSVAIILAARREPIALDIPNNALASAHPMIANFLLADYTNALSQDQEPLKIEWQKKIEAPPQE